MNRMIFFAAIIVSLTAGCFKGVCAEENREFVIGLHMPSSSGIASSKAYQFADAIFQAVGREYGLSFRVDKYATIEEASDKFLDGSADFIQVWPEDMLEIRGKGGEIDPFITYSYGNYTRAWCLWRQKKKDDDSAAGIEIQGKTLIVPSHKKYICYLILREFLNERGIDAPLWEVFSSVIKIGGTNSAMMALSMGKADFLWESTDLRHYMKALNPSLKIKYSKDMCTAPKYERALFGMNRKTVTDDEEAIVTEAMKKALGRTDELAKKYTELQAIHSFMKMINVEIVTAREDPFVNEFALYEKAKKNGWLEEAQFVAAKIKEAPLGQLIEIKPDKEYCEKKCGKSAECIVGCLE